MNRRFETLDDFIARLPADEQAKIRAGSKVISDEIRQALAMQAAQPQFDIRAIQSSWTAFDSMVHLRPIHDDAGYDRMVALLSSLLDTVGDDEEHDLSGLLELVGDVVSKYEREHYAIEAAACKPVAGGVP